MSVDLRIGTAGWSLGRADPACFDGSGSHLERYARVFDAVERRAPRVGGGRVGMVHLRQ